jgi:adenosylcobinamide-phosphate synthase
MGLSVFGSPDLVLALLAGLLVDAAVGRWMARVLMTPSEIAQQACESLERRLNRPDRGERTRLTRGLLVVAVMIAAAVAVALAIRWLGRLAGIPWLMELAAIVVALGGGAAWDRVRAVRRTIETKGAKAATAAIQGLTRRPLDGHDGHAMVRAAIEYLAKAFDRRVMAPAFWYTLLGLPGLMVWSVVDGADAALGVPGIRTSAFGLTAARLDDALNAIPARLAALTLALAALFLGGANCPRAVRTAWKDARRSPSFNMGWPIATMAGALDLSLAGPFRDGGVVVDEPWLGSGRARATSADIGRGLALTGLAGLLTVLGVGLVLALSAGV